MTICDPRLPTGTAQFRIYLVNTGTALSIDMRGAGGKPRTRGPEASDTRVCITRGRTLPFTPYGFTVCRNYIGQRDCGLATGFNNFKADSRV